MLNIYVFAISILEKIIFLINNHLDKINNITIDICNLQYII